jgi:predicted nucleic acid-binding protein
VRYLVDASVVVKWFAEEEQSDVANELLTGEHELCAPDFVLVEAENVFWKKVRSGQMFADSADEALLLLSTGAIELCPTPPLLPRALEMASQIGHPIYDCLYIAAAEAWPAVLITADHRLVDAVERGDWKAIYTTLYDQRSAACKTISSAPSSTLSPIL